MKVKSESEVTQSCPTLSDPMDCSLLGSSIHGIFQAGVLEWGAIPFSRPENSFLKKSLVLFLGSLLNLLQCCFCLCSGFLAGSMGDLSSLTRD